MVMEQQDSKVRIKRIESRGNGLSHHVITSDRMEGALLQNQKFRSPATILLEGESGMLSETELQYYVDLLWSLHGKRHNQNLSQNVVTTLIRLEPSVLCSSNMHIIIFIEDDFSGSSLRGSF